MMSDIIQVSVGTPALLGIHRGKEVLSSIKKSPVGSPLVTVTPEGIVGDEQADTRVVRGNRIHGGQYQAVYAYPLAHLDEWARELGLDSQPGLFGENLTVAGLTEDAVRIGDEFQWGDVRLRVSKARRPCYKLAMHLGIDEVVELMNQTGRCGFYFEVVTPGTVRATAPIELVQVSATGPTIAEAFAAKVRTATPIT